MATGTVKWFNPTKGFGFISQDEAGKDVFVHSNELNGVYINEGDNVEFDIVETEKGLSAQNIKKLVKLEYLLDLWTQIGIMC